MICGAQAGSVVWIGQAANSATVYYWFLLWRGQAAIDGIHIVAWPSGHSCLPAIFADNNEGVAPQKHQSQLERTLELV